MRFAEYCGNRSVYKVFSDQRPVPITDTSLVWLHAPPTDFLEYARKRKPLPFHVATPDELNYKITPTFLIQQAHRHWLTSEALNRYLLDSPDFVMLDLGAFPFAIDFALREYFGRRCRMIATLNFAPHPAWIAELTASQIETAYVNLDPLVRADANVAGMTDSLPYEDGSIDFINFAHVIEHLYQPISILKESYRVLKPNGKMLVSTDNAFMLAALLQFMSCENYVHEPVQGTAAMAFHDWRGHVRFFTRADLKTMLEAVGFRIIACNFHEVLYNSFIEEYFRAPVRELPAWKAALLTSVPDYRNEIILIAEKGASTTEPFSHGRIFTETNLPHQKDVASISQGNREIAPHSLDLLRRGRDYTQHVPFVGTSVFHWFTPTEGNIKVSLAAARGTRRLDRRA